MHREPAIIESTSLGFDEYGVLTARLYARCGESTRVVVGGVALSRGYVGQRDKLVRTTPGAMDLVAGIVQVCGVTTWERVSGSAVRLLLDGHPPASSRVVGVESAHGSARLLFADWQADAEDAVRLVERAQRALASIANSTPVDTLQDVVDYAVVECRAMAHQVAALAAGRSLS